MNVMARDKPTGLWYNSVVMLALVIAHVMINRRLVSLGVAPVGTDPCDGVNAFAFFAIVFIAIGSIVRLFSGHGSSFPVRDLYSLRSQQAALFAIFITFMAEIIALARNPATWIGIVSPTRLFALLGGLTAVTVAAQLLILVTQRNEISLTSLRWTRTVVPIVVALVALTICPEWPTDSPSRTAHILTVALGALVVYVPMRLVLPEIVLSGSDVNHEKAAYGTAREWALLLIGISVDLFGFFRHVPILGADIAQLFIAYALLGPPLGFAGGMKNAMQTAHGN
ncbi:MAG TPA: hypothetical protein VGL22_14965 [Terracidiphilus sp.]|jgi:hypothetical protein